MKDALEFVRDSNSSLKLLTFQPSNVRELETIKYAFAFMGHKLLRKNTNAWINAMHLQNLFVTLQVEGIVLVKV